jgi:hypothetical protein
MARTFGTPNIRRPSNRRCPTTDWRQPAGALWRALGQRAPCSNSSPQRKQRCDHGSGTGSSSPRESSANRAPRRSGNRPRRRWLFSLFLLEIISERASRSSRTSWVAKRPVPGLLVQVNKVGNAECPTGKGTRADAARSPGRRRLSISPSRTRWSPGSAVLMIGFSRTVRPKAKRLPTPTGRGRQ